jgi:hypothetical protein
LKLHGHRLDHADGFKRVVDMEFDLENEAIATEMRADIERLAANRRPGDVAGLLDNLVPGNCAGDPVCERFSQRLGERLSQQLLRRLAQQFFRQAPTPTMTRDTLSSANRTPCGWTNPGMWIDSCSQASSLTIAGLPTRSMCFT